MATSVTQQRKLQDILVPYETRKELFSNLSAFDIAKLDVALGHILNENEQSFYLRPVRDIIWNIPEMNSLALAGMKIVICGYDICLFYQRLYNTKKYLRIYGHRKRLQIYLFGVFPFDAYTDAYRMLYFSISKTPYLDRVRRDEEELKKLYQTSYGGPLISSIHGFIMSFGAPIEERSRGLWYLETDLPDQTIDLRIYIPSYNDRYRGEVYLPHTIVPGLFGFNTRRSRSFRLIAFYVGLRTLAVYYNHLTPGETQGHEEILRFCFTSSLFCEVHY